MKRFHLETWATLTILMAVDEARLAHAADPVKVGPEIVVSDSLDSYVYTPRVASDPAGNFLVVWEDSNDETIEGRGFFATGSPQGPMFQISAPDLVVSEGAGYNEANVAIAADAAGNFVVAFTAYDGDASYQAACYGRPCVYTRRRDANGVLAPASFIVGDPRLNAYGDENYNLTDHPEIASEGSGTFMVTWMGYDESYYSGEDQIGNAVWGRRLVNSGQVNGGQFLVPDVQQGYQGFNAWFDVAADDAGRFAVVWHDENYDYPPYAGIMLKRFDKNNNPIGPQQPVTSFTEQDPHVASTRNGELMVTFGDPTFARVYDSLGAPVGASFLVSSSASYVDVNAAGPSAFVVVWDNSPGGLAGRLFDTAGNAISNEFEISPTGSYPSVTADDVGNFVVAWKVDGYDTRAQRFQVVAPTPTDLPLLGKTMALSNQIPDNFEKSAGKWSAGGGVTVPLRGSASDPRCNGDPPGTVKATARFSSASSGEDTGPIPLPCQNWTATGSNVVSAVAKRGFKYADGQRVHGPCNAIALAGTKSVSVSCKGKAGVASFPYDLVAGVGQGSVIGSLTLGDFTYCAEFTPFIDGSDGKRFRGKGLAVPASCS